MILSNKNKVIKCKLIAWLWNHIYIVYYYIWSYSVCVCGVIMYVYVCLRVHDQIACTCVIANVKPYSVAWHQTIVYCYTVSYWLNIYIYTDIYSKVHLYIYTVMYIYIYIRIYPLLNCHQHVFCFVFFRSSFQDWRVGWGYCGQSGDNFPRVSHIKQRSIQTTLGKKISA